MELKDLRELGFPYTDNVILLFEGGSKMHGGQLEEKADTDIYGIFVEPPEKILGVDAFEHWVYHSGNGPRGTNGPGDVDVCLYGLQKWSRLACKGNPSVLAFLFAKVFYSSVDWDLLGLRPEIFLARSHLGAFLGYANAQLERLYGDRGQKNCNRTFLESQHGYDTKYAMHIVRLLLEARELMQTGRISYPNPQKDLLVQIRRGDIPMHGIVEMANELEKEALKAQESCGLPERVDRALVSQAISNAYRIFWGDRL